MRSVFLRHCHVSLYSSLRWKVLTTMQTISLFKNRKIDTSEYCSALFRPRVWFLFQVLERLGKRFVVLSPTNTSPELSDRSKYPLYLRLTPGQNMGATALLSIVRDLGHQYVQVSLES